jgi:hypothetical protein
MESENGVWDPASVVGLRETDEVLVVGNPAFMPWLTSVARDLTSVRKLSELATLAQEGEEFDKVIIPRETSFSAEHVMFAGPLLKTGGGLIVVFPPDDGWTVQRAIDFYYPDARNWDLETTFGRVLVSQLDGVSWRFYNA